MSLAIWRLPFTDIYIVDLWLAPETGKGNYEKLCILLNIDKENNSFITLAPIETQVGENFNLSIAFDLCYFKAYDFEGCHLLREQAIPNNTPVKFSTWIISLLKKWHLERLKKKQP